jgi:hypothetical protein
MFEGLMQFFGRLVDVPELHEHEPETSSNDRMEMNVERCFVGRCRVVVSPGRTSMITRLPEQIEPCFHFWIGWSLRLFRGSIGASNGRSTQTNSND